MAYSNKCLMLYSSWERQFLMGSGVTECTWAIDSTQRVFDNLWWVNAFTDDISTSVMVSNTVNGL